MPFVRAAASPDPGAPRDRRVPGTACALIDVLVQPRAARERVGPVHGDRIKVAVTAPPVDNAANAALIKLLGKRLAVSRQDLEVVSGQSSRRKTVRVTGLSPDQVRAALAQDAAG